MWRFDVQTHHWVLLIAVFLIGYVFARFFPQLGDLVNLPKA
jgi:hypothetical protein